MKLNIKMAVINELAKAIESGAIETVSATTAIRYISTGMNDADLMTGDAVDAIMMALLNLRVALFAEHEKRVKAGFKDDKEEKACYIDFSEKGKKFSKVYKRFVSEYKF